MKKKKLLGELVVMAIAFFVMVSCSNDEKEYLSQEKPTEMKFDEKSAQSASTIYEELIESFGKSTLKNASTDNVNYPDYYGGAYIDENNELVVYVKDLGGNSNLGNNRLLKNESVNNIKIRDAKYSYRELTEIMDKINSLASDDYPYKELANNVAKASLCDADNCIYVELLNFNEGAVNDFKEKISSSPALIFKKSNGLVRQQIDVTSGSLMNTKKGSGSVGYRAKLNGSNGYVTCGHGFLTNEKVYQDYVEIGTVVKSQISGTIDGSFVKITNSNYAPSNKILKSQLVLSTTIKTPGYGTTVNKAGSKTDITSGSIQSTNTFMQVINHNGIAVKITNVMSATYKSDEGDSGCIVYVLEGSTRYPVGIHCGRNNSGEAFFCKATEINRILGCTMY